MAAPDVQAMSPAQRGRALSRAVGIKRRLEARQRDGLLTAAEATLLRKARATLAALQKPNVALRGTNGTLPDAWARRAELRRQLGITSRRRSSKRAESGANSSLSPQEQEKARAELRAIEKALSSGTASDTSASRPALGRAQPKRITSVVKGGLPGLGRR